MKNFTRLFWLCSIALAFVNSVSGAQVIRTAAGANAAAIQATVDQFRADLGGINNGVGGSFTTGRREINWDGVPNEFASPNNLPVDFFNVNSPRGVIFDSITPHFLRVSANLASGTAVRFGDIDPSYTASFQTFSSERLFAAVRTGNTDDSQMVNIVFFIPGTKIPATVSGFGAVFTDVDFANLSGIICYGTDGKQLGGGLIPVANNGLSFFGVSFNAGERIARVTILTGGYVLQPGNADPPPDHDSLAMDDFIYGEPRAATFHQGDFDGDGITDATVFRPSTGNWFTLNSGSNTVTISLFGLAGDIPVDGDFDGDSRADLAVFRPSVGEWYFQRSSNNSIFGATFGQNGDRPVPADYDKDGKTDIAIWRPGNGNYFILRSSDNFGSFFAFPWGQNGDVPIGADTNQ
ncbi:hypothetical protein BH20ACI4_BH20ACI4_02170 [soil metagenome]